MPEGADQAVGSQIPVVLHPVALVSRLVKVLLSATAVIAAVYWLPGA